jgi:hypothetical protein
MQELVRLLEGSSLGFPACGCETGSQQKILRVLELTRKQHFDEQRVLHFKPLNLGIPVEEVSRGIKIGQH